MTSPASATDPPTVREAVAAYLEHLTTDKRQVVAVALGTPLESVLGEPVTSLSNLRLVLLVDELKGRTSLKMGCRLADSTFRKYVLARQLFWSWCSTRWPRPAKDPGQAAAAEPGAAAGEGPSAGPRLDELIRVLRTDAGLTRQQLGAERKVGEVALKRVELGQQHLSQRQLDQLLTAPCMAGLLAWAEREGIRVHDMQISHVLDRGSGGSGSGTAGGGPGRTRGSGDGGDGGEGVRGAPGSGGTT